MSTVDDKLDNILKEINNIKNDANLHNYKMTEMQKEVTEIKFLIKQHDNYTINLADRVRSIEEVPATIGKVAKWVTVVSAGVSAAIYLITILRG